MSELGGKSVPIEDDAAYWRKMYEEQLALQEAGFSALLAERDRYRKALERIAREPMPDNVPHIDAAEYDAEIAEEALNPASKPAAREDAASGDQRAASTDKPLQSPGLSAHPPRTTRSRAGRTSAIVKAEMSDVVARGTMTPPFGLEHRYFQYRVVGVGGSMEGRIAIGDLTLDTWHGHGHTYTILNLKTGEETGWYRVKYEGEATSEQYRKLSQKQSREAEGA